MFKVNKMDIKVMKLNFERQETQGKKFNLKPVVSGGLGKVGTRYFTEVSVKIQDNKSSENGRFPFNLEATLRAVFDISDVDDEKKVHAFLMKQGVHVLYPYVRAAVSSLTSSAMVSPVTLPIIDAARFASEAMKPEKRE